MIRFNQIKMHTEHTEEQLIKKIASLLHVSVNDIIKLTIVRQSIDARKKPDIFYSYVADVEIKGEEKVLKKLMRDKRMSSQISVPENFSYQFPKYGCQKTDYPIVIVGMGPAGLFCGYYLALHGYSPMILERGHDVERRMEDVECFWNGERLLPNSNVQFGEGGAGTFSDGKLNTLVKDKYGRNKEVLQTLVKFGAPKNILYDAKPHIGTDVLCGIVKSMREEIIRLGGSVRFESHVTDIHIVENQVKEIVVNGSELIPCNQLVLAIGHSARDTFEMLYEKNIPMEQKAFAVGFRVEHPQEMINEALYGLKLPGKLGAAPYKVTAKTSTGRGVYSFCMCPGGYVVNASSEEGRLAVNGMSYSGRNGKNANSAIIVSVTPHDFGSEHPLEGLKFQRNLEEKAYLLAKGKVPVQRYGDFLDAIEQGDDKISGTVMCKENMAVDAMMKELLPQCKGKYEWSELSGILPGDCNKAFVEGMEVFGRQIQGFDHPMTILSGVESRTSSPIRILRDDDTLLSTVQGIYPCGEGAGYAGGITSAAMDGLKVAEAIAAEYKPQELTKSKK